MSGPPVNVNVVANPSTDASIQGSATLFWDPPPNSLPIITYLIQGFIDGIAQTPLIDTGSVILTKYVVDYLFYNTAYSFAIVSRTSLGDAYSSKTRTLTIPLPFNSPPSNLVVTQIPDTTQAVLQWIDPVIHGSDNVTGHSIIVYNLTNGTQYTVTVP